MTRSVLITGCSSGIGYDLAHHLRNAGWRVFATCRAADDVARLREEGLEALELDVADAASIKSAIAEIVQNTGGRLDALVNNAAFALPGALEDLPTDGLRALFETNFFGLHELTRQVIPIMRAQGKGRIVNISSVLGFVPMKWRGAYVSSKYALEGLSDVLRLEMRDAGIDVILIQPGPITSKIRENAIPHFERWIDGKSSPRRAQYETLQKRLYDSPDPDRFELPADAVSRKVQRALEARRPAARYGVTVPTHLMGVLRRLLPARIFEWVISRG